MFEDKVTTHAFFDIGFELSMAENKWPKMHSAHEGYAVILEELDELWIEVQKAQKTGDKTAMRKEAVQVAAMAARFIKDVCDNPGDKV